MSSEEVEGNGLMMQGVNIEEVQKFKYLGSIVQQDVELDGEMSIRIQAGWSNWKKVSGRLYNRKMLMRLKGKVCRTVARPALLYGMQTWPMIRRLEERIDVAEMVLWCNVRRPCEERIHQRNCECG